MDDPIQLTEEEIESFKKMAKSQDEFANTLKSIPTPKHLLHLTVEIDPLDERHEKNRQAYLDWITRTDRILTEAAQKPFVPLKPRVTRENLYNL